MKKFFRFLFLTVLLAILSACRHIPEAGELGLPSFIGEDTVIYVPGWQSQQGEEYEKMVRERQEREIDYLQKTFPGCQVAYLYWNNDVSWSECVANAADLTKKLYQYLRTLPAAERDRIILAGHSLGAKTVINTMASLQRHKCRIQQGVFLGAALADNDPDIDRAVKASVKPVINVYSPADGTLRFLLGSLRKAGPLGAYGNAKPYPPERFLQYRVTPHFTGSDWIHNHWSVFYLERLQQALSTPDTPNEIHPPEPRLKIPYKTRKSNYVSGTSAVIPWKTLRSSHGWRLQQNKILPLQCRLIDRRDFIRAEGNKKEMTESFDSVMKHLKIRNH